MNSKYFLLLIICSLILILSSCEKSWYHEYTVINDTDYDVIINAYDVFGTISKKDNLLETIFIDKHSHYSILKENGDDFEDQGIFKSIEVDSVVIFFDKRRIYIQSCNNYFGYACDFARNIMNYNSGSDFVKSWRGRSHGHNEYTFAYTITNEDYNNAIPIGSDQK